MSSFFRSDRSASTTEEAEAGLRELQSGLRLQRAGVYRQSAVGDATFAVAEVDLAGRFDAQVHVEDFTQAAESMRANQTEVCCHSSSSWPSSSTRVQC